MGLALPSCAGFGAWTLDRFTAAAVPRCCRRRWALGGAGWRGRPDERAGELEPFRGRWRSARRPAAAAATALPESGAAGSPRLVPP
eukprot:15483318-Alexandrium_andersonii.AAC.1